MIDDHSNSVDVSLFSMRVFWAECSLSFFVVVVVVVVCCKKRRVQIKDANRQPVSEEQRLNHQNKCLARHFWFPPVNASFLVRKRTGEGMATNPTRCSSFPPTRRKKSTNPPECRASDSSSNACRHPQNRKRNCLKSVGRPARNLPSQRFSCTSFRPHTRGQHFFRQPLSLSRGC
jgi:hypothetical protein